MAKQTAVKGDDQKYIAQSVVAALNADPEIKGCFKPASVGLKAGDSTYIVMMGNGKIYRLTVKVTEGVEETES